MDYEKKYKEALERARGFYNNEECRVGMTPIDLEVIFPELRENEEEKIRKGIISTLKFANHNGIYDKYIEWLEKQDEKLRGKTALEAIKEPKDYNSIDPYFAKPIDKVEPKFYEGEWVVQGDNILKLSVLEIRTIVLKQLVAMWMICLFQKLILNFIFGLLKM